MITRAAPARRQRVVLRDLRPGPHDAGAHRVPRAPEVARDRADREEEDLERALQHRVRLVPAADLERHVDEVADVGEVVARQHLGQAAVVAEDERRDRRQLRQPSRRR